MIFSLLSDVSRTLIVAIIASSVSVAVQANLQAEINNPNNPTTTFSAAQLKGFHYVDVLSTIAFTFEIAVR